MESKEKASEKKKLVEKLWDVAENGNFRPYSEYKKDRTFS